MEAGIDEQLCRARAHRHLQSQLWFAIYFLLSPLLIVSVLGALLAAVDADRVVGRVLAIAFLCLAFAGLITPGLVYRRLFARRLIIERQIDAARQCNECGYNLEGLFTPTCPKCGWTPPIPGEKP